MIRTISLMLYINSILSLQQDGFLHRIVIKRGKTLFGEQCAVLDIVILIRAACGSLRKILVLQMKINIPQCRTYFHASGKKEEKAEFRPVPIAAVTLVKNKTAKHAWGIEKFRPYLNPKRTVRHLGAVPRCSTNPDSMKGIHRGSTPPVGQKEKHSP